MTYGHTHTHARKFTNCKAMKKKRKEMQEMSNLIFGICATRTFCLICTHTNHEENYNKNKSAYEDGQTTEGWKDNNNQS